MDKPVIFFLTHSWSKKMGRGDRRKSLKMIRAKGQSKKKARVARALAAAKADK